jgi:amino acid transporter
MTTSADQSLGQAETVNAVSPSDGSLQRNVLNLREAIFAGIIQIGPAGGLIFAVGAMAAVAGSSVPLVFLLGMLGVAATGSTFGQFSKRWPSAGSFITFVSRAIDPRVGVAIGVTALMGYVITFAGIYVFAGWYIAHEIMHNPHIWALSEIMMVIFAIAVVAPVIAGLRLGIRVSAVMYLFEITVLLIFTAAILLQGGDHGLSAHPFSLSGVGLKGVGLAFAIAITVYIGFEAPAPLAEETANPRRNVPIAIMATIFISGAILIAASYALVIAFPSTVQLLNATAPFTTAANRFVSPVGAIITWLLVTSLAASFIAANTETARVIYNGAREGIWYHGLARVHPRLRTPWLAAIAFVAPSIIIGLVCEPLMGEGTAVGFLSTYGGLGVIFMYAALNVALVVLWFRERAGGERQPVLTWVVVPIIGLAILALPYWASFQPGQPSPYSDLPWLMPLLVAAGALYAAIIWIRKPELHDRIGSLVMGETTASDIPHDAHGVK